MPRGRPGEGDGGLSERVLRLYKSKSAVLPTRWRFWIPRRECSFVRFSLLLITLSKSHFFKTHTQVAYSWRWRGATWRLLLYSCSCCSPLLCWETRPMRMDCLQVTILYHIQ